MDQNETEKKKKNDSKRKNEFRMTKTQSNIQKKSGEEKYFCETLKN